MTPVLCLIASGLCSDVYADIPMGFFRVIKAGNKSNSCIKSEKKMGKIMDTGWPNCWDAILNCVSVHSVLGSCLHCYVAPIRWHNFLPVTEDPGLSVFIFKWFPASAWWARLLKLRTLWKLIKNCHSDSERGLSNLFGLKYFSLWMPQSSLFLLSLTRGNS